MDERPKWQWKDPDCLRAFWALFKAHNSLPSISANLKVQYEKAPSGSSLAQRVATEEFRDQLEAIAENEEEVDEAYRAFYSRKGQARPPGFSAPSAPPLRLRPLPDTDTFKELDPKEEKRMERTWNRLFAGAR